MESEITINFRGPFSWRESSRSKIGLTFPDLGELADRSGVYMWTVQLEGKERVFHVGGTSDSFKRRLGSHLTVQSSGRYGIYDAKKLRDGRRETIYRGLDNVRGNDKEVEAIRFQNEGPELIRKSRAYYEALRIWVAPIETTAHLWLVEAGIYDSVKSSPKFDVREFLPPMYGHTLTRRNPKRLIVNINPPIFEDVPAKIRV